MVFPGWEWSRDRTLRWATKKRRKLAYERRKAKLARASRRRNR